MRKGRITIPTDENYVEGTKRIADLWGADVVRGCDGVVSFVLFKERLKKKQLWCLLVGIVAIVCLFF